MNPSRSNRAVAVSTAVAAVVTFGCKGILGIDDGTLLRGSGSGSGGSASEGGVDGSSEGGTGRLADNPSCQGLAPICGPSGRLDCCASRVLPGGQFRRSYDRTSYLDPTYRATVSPFALDKYEVTVGRFRTFMAAYSRDMVTEGAGMNPNNTGDPGWDTDWNASLPEDATALACEVYGSGSPGVPPPPPPPPGAGGPDSGSSCDPATPELDESRPVAIHWYLAFAFCVWDGGRLPTEAEWNYAAAGGDEQRPYAWGSEAPDRTRAVANLRDSFLGSPRSPETVGSTSPEGDGRWGHADLAGNLAEWTLDWYRSPYSDDDCIDCAETAEPNDGDGAMEDPSRVIRGGSYTDDAAGLLSSFRLAAVCPGVCSDYTVGFRCAREAE